MSNRTQYEWVVEIVDLETGDIIDTRAYPTARDMLADAADGAPEGYRVDTVLVRDVIRHGDLHSRSWAYITATGLPGRFEDAFQCYEADVPKKCQREFAQALKQAA